MPDPIITPLVNVTARALESFNPMGGTIVDQPFSAQRLKLPPKVETPEVVEEVEIEVEENDFEFDAIEPIVEEAPVEEATVQEVIVEKKKPTKKAKNPIIETRSQEGLPSYRCEFEGRDIMVGWPWYKTSNPVTTAVNVALALDFGRDRIRFDMSIGDAMIYHSRNILVEKFMDTDAKWLFMMDDDIIPSIGRPSWIRNWIPSTRSVLDAPLQRHVLHRLIGANKTLIGGAYFGRQEGAALMCSNIALGPRAKVYEDIVVEVDWVATGCMLVHRQVFDDIRAKFPDQATPDNKAYKFDYFLPTKTEGEDVAFCKRAKLAGHQSHIDLGLPVFHVGYKTY
jgi:hypothetical protein